MDRHQVIGLPPRPRKPPFQELIERFQVLQPPVLSRPHLAQIARPSSTNFVSRSVSLRCSQARISSILPSTNRARWRLNFGGMGGFLVTKLVKPIKTLCSWTPHQSGVNHLLLSKTKSHVRTATAGILGKADPTVRQEVCGLNSSNRVLYQATEFLALLVSDRGAEVLNLHPAFANEYHLGDFRNARHPGVANQLRIQRQ